MIRAKNAFKIKKIFSVLLALIIVLSTYTLVNATDSNIENKCGDNLTWTFDEVAGVLTISGEGEMCDFQTNDPIPWSDLNCHTIIIEDGVSSVGDWAFSWLPNLKKVTFPDSITRIGKYAFCNTSLESIDIPAGVKEIGKDPFGTSSLKQISVSKENKYYTNDEYGALLDKDMAVLIQYPSGNSSEIYIAPDSVKTISEYAFYHAFSLKKVCFSADSQLETIEHSAFLSCNQIETISLPEGLKNIANDAFGGCENLKDVEYYGAEENWYAINILLPNPELFAANIYCRKNVLPGKNGNVFVEYMDGAVENASCVNATEISLDDIKNIEHNFEIGDGLNVCCVYDITLLDPEGNVVPNNTIKGKITVKIKFPSNISNKRKVKIVHYSKDGTPAEFYSYGENLEDKKFVIENNEYIVFEVEHFSYFIVCVDAEYPTLHIRNKPQNSTINYGDTLSLSADTTNLTEEMQIVWYVNGEQKGTGETFSTTIKDNIEISVKITDLNGNAILDENGNEISDSQKITVKSGFFQKLVSFFKNLFRLNRVIVQSLGWSY